MRDQKATSALDQDLRVAPVVSLKVEAYDRQQP